MKTGGLIPSARSFTCGFMNVSDLEDSAAEAAGFLRTLANEKRLMIVCQLVDGEKNVGELCDALSVRQSTVSQQLALLRAEGVVKSRKEAQTVFYSLANENARRLVGLLYELFCNAAHAGKTVEETADEDRRPLA